MPPKNNPGETIDVDARVAIGRIEVKIDDIVEPALEQIMGRLDEVQKTLNRLPCVANDGSPCPACAASQHPPAKPPDEPTGEIRVSHKTLGKLAGLVTTIVGILGAGGLGLSQCHLEFGALDKAPVTVPATMTGGRESGSPEQ